MKEVKERPFDEILKEYFEIQNDSEKRFEMFKKEIAPRLGKADPATLAFRKKCEELGCHKGVVFSNLSREETLKVLESAEMQEIIKNTKE